METSSLITEMFCFPNPQPTEMSESVTNSFRIQKLLAACTKKIFDAEVQLKEL